jgi:hypothetical protein
MTSFTTEWTDDALDELTLLWLQAPDPAAVVRAQAQIDYVLSHDPLGHGVEISEGLRELTEPPLRVLYSVDTTKQTVEVSSVKPSA